MANVFVECALSSQVSSGSAINRIAPVCPSVHGIPRRGSLTAVVGTRSLCHFAAPDIDSVRTLFRRHSVKFDAIRGATIHGNESTSAATRSETAAAPGRFAVETLPSAPIDVTAHLRRQSSLLHMLSACRVSPLQTIVSLDRRRVLQTYRMPDAGVLSRVRRRAGIMADRISAYRRIDDCPLIVEAIVIRAAIEARQ
jgi:hypothetical protein